LKKGTKTPELSAGIERLQKMLL